MEVVILADAKEIGVVAADAIGALLDRKPAAVIGLATGSSPIAIYEELATRCDAGLISFRQARGFTLDEYVGLPADHPQRYRNVIDTAFASRVDFAPGAVQGPDGLATDIPAACAAYENAIREAGGVDLQILGIGT
ncbi:MAG: glucosamine-6-phosphate deaminase, partial [Mycobacterium sp.]|nr:glucosamine-6-phosphate deaminase [Mycobacterium sp.]